jgi:hypothetical protein
MTDLVLVSKPEALNIPYFAMEREPHSFMTKLNLDHERHREGPDPSRLLGRKVAEWVQEHQGNAAAAGPAGGRKTSYSLAV